MKNIKENWLSLKKFLSSYWLSILIIFIVGLVLIPLLVLLGEHTLTGGWFSEAGNDGWLGFWGGFLGAIISVLGVYISFLFTRKNDLRREKRDYRPAINSLSQYGIKVNDTVFHSTASIGIESFNSNFFTLENLTTNPMLNTLFIVKTSSGIGDIISVSSLTNKKVLISYRHSDNEVEKIEIVFQTLREEYGLFSKELDGNKILNPKVCFGDYAKEKYNEYVTTFEEHNKDINKVNPKFYNQNISVFNEKDYNLYEKYSKEYWDSVSKQHDEKE